MGFQRCQTCGVSKPVSEANFYFHRGGYYFEKICKKCRQKESRERMARKRAQKQVPKEAPPPTPEQWRKQRNWVPSPQQVREQRLCALLMESPACQEMDDEEWCEFLERKGRMDMTEMDFDQATMVANELAEQLSETLGDLPEGQRLVAARQVRDHVAAELLRWEALASPIDFDDNGHHDWDRQAMTLEREDYEERGLL